MASVQWKCLATVSKNGEDMFLLKPDPLDGGSHLMGQISKAIVQFAIGETWEVTFRKVEPEAP
jgi:hypothetical protein